MRRSSGEVSGVTKEAARVRPASEFSPARAAATGAVVAGHVEDPDGRPAAGAEVTCTQGDAVLTARTDDQGRFELEAGAAGCRAIARKRGFGPSLAEELNAGSSNRLRLRPPAGIAGNVVDDKGAPIVSFSIGVASFAPAASSDAADANALAAFKRPVDDPQGAFEFTDLTAGRYELVVSVVEGPLSRSQSIGVAEGAMTKGVRVVVQPATRVSGIVTDAATHAPIAGARVYVGMGGLTTRSPAVVDGTYVLDDAPAGRFDLTAFAPGYRFKVLPDLQAPPGSTQLRVDLELERIF
jgi:hypothetical protein